VILRLVLWNLADSKTSLDELKTHLPPPADGDVWIANEPQERFGLVSTGDAPPDFEHVRGLIGKDPEVLEEFDVL
jgi:hypothetical protein